MPVHLTILGSGSAGNCAYLETGETRILIDAGFSLRGTRKRLAAIGRTPENLTGILVTHEHSDHVQGLAALSEKLHIPVYCNRATKEAIEWQLKVRLDCRLFETGSSFEVGEVGVEAFTIPHDAQDPVFSSEGKYLFFVSQRDFNPVFGRTEFNHVYQDMSRIFFVTLAKDTESPFKPRSDEVGAARYELRAKNSPKQSTTTLGPLRSITDKSPH